MGSINKPVVDGTGIQAKEVEIEAGEDSIRAVRIGDAWRLLSPMEDVGDRDHLEALVSDLGALRIEEFLDGEIDSAAIGLDVPEYSVVVVRSDGGEPLRLELGAIRESNIDFFPRIDQAEAMAVDDMGPPDAPDSPHGPETEGLSP